ncbi:hypothetical protein F8M41_025660 [Gigaspora margarita]|uniref:Uncharacterized protein n=1 Tax=Gigaspora margarita TaxID=4874 RepID=A0A8H3XK46_GIGMA|nr:hypothetical protein F8M41_025660 [Gigaspora margarita]
MPLSKIIAPSCAAKFGPDVFANNGLLKDPEIYIDSKSISFENRTSITSYLASEAHKTKYEQYLKKQSNRQTTNCY